MNQAAKELTARMARRMAAQYQRQVTQLQELDTVLEPAFRDACNADSQMRALQGSEAVRRYFETVFISQFDTLGDYRGQ